MQTRRQLQLTGSGYRLRHHAVSVGTGDSVLDGGIRKGLHEEKDESRAAPAHLSLIHI